ncbi:MAG: hypothetical protein J6S38_02490 [Erysipelotrichaceae bacterium]|nr:hypothetical protein [Erysipelotrichaceae bacterium]
MEEVLLNLKKRIADLAEGIRKKEIRPEDVDGHVYEIIDEAAELYKREDIKLLMPLNNGGPLLFQENGIYFIPLYSCKEEIKECMASDFSNVSFKLICDYVFGLISSEQEFPVIKGIMLDPESDDLFSFDDWILQAIVAKGMGADSFRAFDEKTGEVKHQL